MFRDKITPLIANREGLNKLKRLRFSAGLPPA